VEIINEKRWPGDAQLGFRIQPAKVILERDFTDLISPQPQKNHLKKSSGWRLQTIAIIVRSIQYIPTPSNLWLEFFSSLLTIAGVCKPHPGNSPKL
jgi:hypothetical protein